VQLAARAATDAAIAKLGTPVVASTSSTSDFQDASGVHGRRPRARNRRRRLQASGRRPSSPSPLFLRSVGTIGFVGKCQNSGREWASLIIAKISLIAQFNSLQGGNKFPVRMRRELARKGSDLMPIFGRDWRAAKPESMKFPVFSQLAGNLGFRDEFARDCPLQGRVHKPPVPPAISRG
jgi:hypothetical protein